MVKANNIIGSKRIDAEESDEEEEGMNGEGEFQSSLYTYEYYQFPIHILDLVSLEWTEVLPSNPEYFIPRSFHTSCHGKVIEGYLA